MDFVRLCVFFLFLYCTLIIKEICYVMSCNLPAVSGVGVSCCNAAVSLRWLSNAIFFLLASSSISSHWRCITNNTSGYATMVHGRGCNPHRCMTTFANLEITSLWRRNSETIRDREKRRPPRAMKSSELSNGENRIALRQLLQNRKWRHW